MKAPFSRRKTCSLFLTSPAWAAAARAMRQRHSGWLATGSWVYVERAAARPVPVLPIGFTLWREGRAGDVGCQLLRWEPPTP